MSQDFQQPPQKSGGMSVLMIVLIVVGVLFLGCAGFCGVSGYMASVAVKEASNQLSQAIELIGPSIMAQSQIELNEEVAAKFGETLEIGPAARSGDTTKELDTSDAQFTMTVASQDGSTKGVAHVKAAQMDGLWKVLEIQVKCDDGTVIDVPPPEGDQPPELNFGDPIEDTTTEPETEAGN